MKNKAGPPMGADRSRPQPPRPDLLPAQMRGGAAQAKLGGGEPGVPRPDLLPPKMRGGVAQANSAGSGPGGPRLDPVPAKLPGMVGQPKLGGSGPGVPRPDLLPPKMRGGAAQARPAGSGASVSRPGPLPAKLPGMVGQAEAVRGIAGPWSGAPRPASLPTMAPTRIGGLRGVAQAPSGAGVAVTPVPAGKLHMIGGGRPLAPGARTAQAMWIPEPKVQNCIHCNSFLNAQALLETGLVKVTRCVFKSSLYVISKRHREDGSLSLGIQHLHHTVLIAQQLIQGDMSIGNYSKEFWRNNITHVKMNIGPTKHGYEGYEHYHSFIVLKDETERQFQVAETPQTTWARNWTVGTELHGDVYNISYGQDTPYELAVEDLYERKPLVKGLTPVYFSIVFANGIPEKTFFSV